MANLKIDIKKTNDNNGNARRQKKQKKKHPVKHLYKANPLPKSRSTTKQKESDPRRNQNKMGHHTKYYWIRKQWRLKASSSQRVQRPKRKIWARAKNRENARDNKKKKIHLLSWAAPIVERGLGIGQVISILSLHVIEARSLVEVSSLRIKRSSVLAVKNLKQRHGANLT